jgi:hypothetical protein
MNIYVDDYRESVGTEDVHATIEPNIQFTIESITIEIPIKELNGGL